MTSVFLDAMFRPRPSSFLRRMGRDFDGGYLVDERDIAASDCLIGFGINADWSFEKNYHATARRPVYAYDASTNMRFLLGRLWHSILNFRRKPTIPFKEFYLVVDYVIFFSRNRRLFSRFIGHGNQPFHMTLGEVFADVRADGRRKPFLKIDIEGSEYQILDELVEHARDTAGLVIEFHAIDSHLDEISRFLAAYPLNLIHVHGNNWGNIAPRQMPSVVELTFSSHEPDLRFSALPHPLDQPNNPRDAELEIAFRD